jgi:hypothetical protein
VDRAAYYRRRAEECRKEAALAPEPMRGPLLALAQQWTRLAYYAQERAASGMAEPGQSSPAAGRQIWFCLPQEGDQTSETAGEDADDEVAGSRPTRRQGADGNGAEG